MPARIQSKFPVTAWLLFFFLVFVGLGPLHPQMPTVGLDPSWVQVINFAYLHGLQWGRDIVFTYGPLGFIFSKPFHPELFVTLLLYWLLIGTAFSLAMVAIFHHKSWQMNAVALVVACLLLPFFSAGFDAFFLLLCTLSLLHYVYGGERLFRVIQLLLIIAVAAVSLMKTTVAIFAAFSFLLIDIIRLSNKRAPIHLILWSVLYIAFYLSAGQKMTNLPEYWYTSLEIARGYGPAMSMAGLEDEFIAFLSLSAALLIGFLVSLVRKPSWLRISVFLGLSALWFFSYKQGFTRHDLHSNTSWLGLFFLIFIFIQLVCRTRSRRTLSFGVFLLVLLLYAIAESRGDFEKQVAANTEKALGYWNARLADATDFVQNPFDWYATKTTRYEEVTRQLGKDYHWIKPGTRVDTIPSIQSAIIFSRADYTPRPIFQEYSTYTADLIELNRQFFIETPPELLVFSPFNIDGRFPALTEGSSWPVIFNTYYADSIYDGHLILKRRKTPLRIQATQVAQLQGKLSEPITIPKTKGFTFIQIDTDKTLSGKWSSLLLKNSQLYATISRTGHGAKDYRMIPAIAQKGFFIDPHFGNALDLMDAFFQTEKGVTETSDIQLLLWEQPVFGTKQTDQDITIRVYEYDYNNQDMLSDSLANIWQKHAINYRLAASSARGRPFGYAEQDLIHAHAPAGMSNDIHDVASIGLRYGIRAGAVDKMHQVCFEMTLEQEPGPRESRKACLKGIPGWKDKLQRPFLWNFNTPVSGRLNITTSCVDDKCGFAWAYLKDLTITQAKPAGGG